jgi:hypothetical protein
MERSSAQKKSPMNRLYGIIHNLDMESKSVVSFGKYKSQTYETILLDSKYCKWICNQNPSTIEMLLLKQFIEKIQFITGQIPARK